MEKRSYHRQCVTCGTVYLGTDPECPWCSSRATRAIGGLKPQFSRCYYYDAPYGTLDKERERRRRTISHE